ncbi:MAG: B12-binding domain-containing radical SAM protein [Nitrospinae bacterium]|nr:B12-binding domain-containing radical SAM protein [Nitrospinota bacterium]
MKHIDCLIFVPGINAIAHRERFTTIYDFPRGALSLASFLKAKGVSSLIIPLDFYMPPSNNPEDIEAGIGKIVEAISREYRPLVAGISAPYTMLYPASLKIAENCKKFMPSAITCMGGPHVSYRDTQCFEDSAYVDIIVRGEGEWALLEIIDAVKNKRDLNDIKGITFRIPPVPPLKKGGEGGFRIIQNPPHPLGDINELPILDYTLLPEDFVRNMAVSIVASRGCAYKCSYCNESKFWGHKVRKIPIDKVMEEIRILGSNYNNYPVGLEDSMFDMRSSYFFEFCSRLSGLRLNPNLYLLSRVDSVSEDGYGAMRKAGIRNIILGIESASQKVLQFMNKKITAGQAEDACKTAAGSGLIVGAFWIIGHPGDSPAESEITLKTMDKFYSEGILQTSEVALFVPYPGTDIFEQPEKYELEILSYDWERWGRFNTDPVCRLKDFKSDEIKLYWKKGVEIDRKWRNKK